MMDTERRPLELAVDGDRLIEWLGREAAAQRESMRNQCLLAAILAAGFSLLVLVLGRGPAGVPALAVAALLVVVLVASFRRRVEEGARTAIDSLRDRPDDIRRIAHVVYRRHFSRTDAVVIEGNGDGYLFVKTRQWDVVLNGLAARCRNARVELCGSRSRHRR